MNNIVFLVSSNGGTLKFLNEYFKLYSALKLKIVYVIADRPCKAIDYAEDSLIPAKVVMYNKENRSNLLKLLSEINPDYIITNIFKILDPKLVETFKNRLINFHYSLLPAFKGFIGIEALKHARKLNCQFVGSTCHLVDEKVDNGDIIGQLFFQLKPTMSNEFYTNIMFRANCIMALSILLSFTKEYIYTDSSINILGCTVHYSPSLSEEIVFPDEKFWDLIKSL
jgi:phosphoribosylglycinamide formyltransferase-1